MQNLLQSSAKVHVSLRAEGTKVLRKYFQDTSEGCKARTPLRQTNLEFTILVVLWQHTLHIKVCRRESNL